MPSESSGRQLVWLRTDLRLADNPALSAAREAGPVLALYLLTPGQWQQHGDAPCKVDFWLRNLKVLASGLAALNIPLLVREVPEWADVPAVLAGLCQQYQVSMVRVNEEYGINETRRDQAVRTALAATGTGFSRYLDQLFLAPGQLLASSGRPFQVYTPFRNACRKRLAEALPRCLPALRPQAALAVRSDPLPGQVRGFPPPAPALQAEWPAGEVAARERLAHFADQQLLDYHLTRDFPALAGTSRLSPYLAAGVLSPRQCLQAALAQNGNELAQGNPGVVCWIDELLWREFYRHILQGFPGLSMHQPFRPETGALPWREDAGQLQAWQQGQTGFPLIDAAMRCLLATGWMHNRLRMLVAMFLSKNLLIHWQAGEHWFMQQLIDGDLAQNNGGWQWSASTGTDAVPWFRLFNPVTQSKKFDPQGIFIRRWVPELAGLDAREIHEPPLQRRGRYPGPLVELAASRARVLQAFRGLPAGVSP